MPATTGLRPADVLTASSISRAFSSRVSVVGSPLVALTRRPCVPWIRAFLVWRPCNPLKSHKTAKGMLEILVDKQVRFGNPWQKAWRLRPGRFGRRDRGSRADGKNGVAQKWRRKGLEASIPQDLAPGGVQPSTGVLRYLFGCGASTSDRMGGKFSSLQSLEKPQNAKILAPSSSARLPAPTRPLAPEPPRRGRACYPRSTCPRFRPPPRLWRRATHGWSGSR
jgi:hypothetical protein